jgi:amino acid transporter
MWLTLTLFGLAGLIHAPAVDLHGGFGPSRIGTSVSAILSLVGTAMFMFVGFEFVTPLAAEIRNPTRAIPKAMALGLWAVALCMVMYGTAVNRQVPNTPLDAQTYLLDTPMAVPRFAEAVFGHFGRIWLGVGLLFAGAATINTLMAGLPRILYGMALDGALPRAFAYLHPRLKTPVVAIAVSAAIPCVHAWIIHGDVSRLGNLVLAAVCAWGVAYILVTISVIALRIRRPDLPRPYRAPAYPLPQIISLVGISTALAYIAPLGTSRREVYVPFGVMLVITALYALIWIRFVRKAPLFVPEHVEAVLERARAQLN